MTKKSCTKCNKEKRTECFSKNRSKKDGLNSHCKDCHSVYIRAHYQKNKKYYKERIAAKKNENKKQNLKLIRGLKEQTPCADCGKKYPYYVMDFDHINGQKKDVVSKLTKSSPKIVLAEIKKCEIVCANCHRMRTFAPVV